MSAGRRTRTPFEIAVLVIAITAVALIVAGLVIARLTGESGPPDLRVTVRGTGEQGSGGDLYEVSIRNVGGETAENVVIEVTLGDETREVEILSVAKGDEEQATVVFPAGSTGAPSARVLSYHMTTRG